MKDFEKRVTDVMIFAKIIPESGLFQIEEKHLSEYIKIYGEIFATKDKGLKRNQEVKFARKLAGRTLIRLLHEREFDFSDVRAGMVYMISNPVYPEHFKIGMTMDVVDRLASYQTYDPFKRFKLEKYNFVLDRRGKEKQLLNHPDIFKEDGEWVKRKNAEELFLKIAV